MVLGVVGPNTAILEGQKTFLILLSLARLRTLNREFILRFHALIGNFSAVAESIAANKYTSVISCLIIISSSAFDAYLSTKNKMIRKNGIIIITTASPEGGGYHSLGGYGMKLFEYTDKFPLIKEAIKDKIIYIFSPNLTPQEVYKYYSHSVLFFREWDRLIENLKEEYYSKCRIAIFPNASIQLIKYNDLKKNI